MILDDRTIEDMLGCAGQPAEAACWRSAAVHEGWREPLVSGQGFRHRYDESLGDGGWVFHQLNDALSMAIVDFRAARPLSRLHRHDDHLVFCAWIEGRSTISAGGDLADEELAHGFCTFYGLPSGDAVRTVYEPDRPLRWVSIFLRRDRVKDVLGLDAQALPAIFRDYILHRAPTGLRHVPLGSAASIAATQAFECPYEGELRRLYLIAKAIEIVCAVIQSHAEDNRGDGHGLRRADVEKVKLAREIIERNLDEPLSVSELAAAVGMTIKKLQYGFQVMFRGSVGQVYKQVRLSRAMALVSKSDMPMIDIAIECGYECPGSFTRAFKLAFGSCPTLVRGTASRAAMAGPPRDRSGCVPASGNGSLVN
ncbi:AraC family transcriptional regulator [Luteimonas sp. BDR2-5]|uniref:helix-turn-helix transcriptional regulator n=1 Tax=Proluteimonas luteida TaxID=2878685 RepID=UPI001E32418C|nr:AraC family transcriptional regulator [Luteimonas sp. BDR2-5]MCD9028217.1 AraC family transcriptional regulator [Luteimonas sp. BDR2-5]